ncbi:MAG: hypothetical protein NZ602_11015 [Thermoguttaceae bacterium]|nr:hypothetical protein [Thermoguttaceae bacterium]MDW8037446.1 hypothetical protein [Thermoguttaceae bacterium]
MQAVKVLVRMVVAVVVFGGADAVWAQCGCEVPVLPAPSSAIGTSYLPVVAEPVLPVAPTPVVVYQPVVPAPVATPMVVYRPVVPVVPVSSVVVYRPSATEVLMPAPVLVGRPAIISTKVYYPGEPIRNLIKALLP